MSALEFTAGWLGRRTMVLLAAGVVISGCAPGCLSVLHRGRGLGVTRR